MSWRAAAAFAILRRTDYLKELRPLRRELGLHLLIRSVLNSFRSSDYDRLLGLLNERTIRLLGRGNRDQAAGMLLPNSSGSAAIVEVCNFLAPRDLATMSAA